jgi:hypothetical protein
MSLLPYEITKCIPAFKCKSFMAIKDKIFGFDPQRT